MSQTRNVTATYSSAVTYQLLVSTAADRSNSVELNGFSASGNMYVFTSPTTSVSQVRFFLDDASMVNAPRSIDTTAPYDFNGTAGNGTANPFDSTSIASGTHTITAALDLAGGGTTVISGSFTAPGPTVPAILDEDWEGGYPPPGWQLPVGGNMTVVTTQHYTGTKALQMVYPSQVGTSTSHVELVPFSPCLTDAWARFMLKLQPGFLVGNNALSKMWNFVGLNYGGDEWFELFGSAPGGVGSAPSGVRFNYNAWDFNDAQFLQGNVPVADGNWHQVELNWRFNTPGVSDGWIKLYFDNALIAQTLNRQLRGPASNSTSHGIAFPSNACLNWAQIYQQSGLGTLWIDRLGISGSRLPNLLP
jgi:hypothetical protein